MTHTDSTPGEPTPREMMQNAYEAEARYFAHVLRTAQSNPDENGNTDPVILNAAVDTLWEDATLMSAAVTFGVSRGLVKGRVPRLTAQQVQDSPAEDRQRMKVRMMECSSEVFTADVRLFTKVLGVVYGTGGIEEE